jgi:hypothetical protein
MAQLAKKHKLTIVVNHEKIAEANASAKTPLARSVRDTPLEVALKELLHDVGLDYIVRDEVVEVTTREMADTYLVHRIYPVGDVVVPPTPGKPSEEAAPADYESLIDLMVRLVQPDSWAAAGGPATADSLPGSLMIRQTLDAHRQVEVFLKALRKARTVATAPGEPAETSLPVFESAGEQRIEGALRRRVAVAFHDVTLGDIATAISKEHGIPVELDRKNLGDAEIDVDKARWSFTADGITLRSALRWMLGRRGVSWIVREGRLVITSREQAETYVLTRFYPVGDLVPDGRHRAAETVNASGPIRLRVVVQDADDWLPRTIRGAVLPDHWRDAGGPAEIDWAPQVPLLICSMHQEGHLAIERLLADLRRHGVKSPARPAAETRQPPTAVWAYPITGDPAHRAKLAAEAARLIQEKIAPATWNAKDADAFIRAWPDRIVIRHTSRVHREVQDLLQEVGLLQPPTVAEPPAPPPSDE